MKMKSLVPSPKYVTKLRVVVTLLVFLCWLGLIWVAPLIAMDGEPGGALIFAMICSGLAVVMWVIGMLLSGPYANSLRYEIHEDEVIVHVGIITKSVKHVPFRTVTNITSKRGLLDRYIFDLGTLNIQTAGMSGNQGAEESLVGLPNVQEVYEMVATELRRFRSGMTPTQAELELDETAVPTAPKDNAATMEAMLTELRSIHELLARAE